jgi:EAL and modified HD-GYP domain-containing signal transduction protein
VPSRSAATQLVHIGRQPVYDRDGHVVAYELLFRGNPADPEDPRRSLYATSQIIVNAFTEFGLEQIVGGRQCFINLTRDFLTGDLPVPFEPGQAVLEIVESVDIDDDVLRGVSQLVALGYPIAISAAAAGDGYYELRRLASYVKVDVQGADRAAVEATVAELRQFPEIRLIAERADTDELVELAEWLSFDFFQGQALGRPQILSIQSLSPSRMRRLELLGALNAEDVNLEKVVSIVTGDPGLSFRVLRATNSAATGLPRKVSSVRDAVVMLGLTKIRQWVALMLVSDIAESATDDQLATTMARARLCQIVADRLDLPEDAAFTVGLLAGIAELISEPVSELAQHLPLTREVTDALVRGAGRLGQVLTMVRAYEATDVNALQHALVSSADLAKAYLAAVGWSVRTVDGVLGGNGPRRLPPAATSRR